MGGAPFAFRSIDTPHRHQSPLKESVMYATPTLATRFARNTFVVRSEAPLAEDQMRRAVHLRGRQAHEPLRSLHLHPDH